LLGIWNLAQNVESQRAGLEILQRCGITLISKSVTRDQDKIGEVFLREVQIRKQEIEIWCSQRKVLDSLVSAEQTQANGDNGTGLKLLCSCDK
jgi:hypothetical protein